MDYRQSGRVCLAFGGSEPWPLAHGITTNTKRSALRTPAPPARSSATQVPRPIDGGATVAGLAMMASDFRTRLHELAGQWKQAAFDHPRALAIAVSICVVLAVVPVGLGIWVLTLRRGLPDEHAVSRIGEMDQATTIYDASDNVAFTIFKEQR